MAWSSRRAKRGRNESGSPSCASGQNRLAIGEGLRQGPPVSAWALSCTTRSRSAISGTLAAGGRRHASREHDELPKTLVSSPSRAILWVRILGRSRPRTAAMVLMSRRAHRIRAIRPTAHTDGTHHAASAPASHAGRPHGSRRFASQSMVYSTQTLARPSHRLRQQSTRPAATDL